jgi:adenosylcobinamide-GDP ribazoletransferase
VITRRGPNLAPLWAALRLLTCLPLPASAGATPGALVGSLVWFPAVGAVLGALLGLLELGVRTATHNHAIACGLAVALGLLLTQGRPARGLMVISGALFGGRDPESVAQLAAHTWPTRFGLLVGMAVLLLKYALLMAIPGEARLGALLLALGLSRGAMVWVCWRFPYAHMDTGIGGWLVSLAGPPDLVLVLPVMALGLALLGPTALASLAGAWLLAHGFAYWVTRALTGLTAQACEATAEVGEIGALAVVAVLTSLTLA